ncbi:methylecgonone reductase-like [Vigna umbellata]|uniref:methylecgonone reductase-like n=1 Tax=Vigna umbellata TaxID=87088 RepID=UPI001F5E6642|nr:methylecgonone reductase-like [Vigna umbellata]
MEAKKIPEVILNSGKKMPAIGLGTGSFPLPPHETLISILIDAFEVGYRHFDTATFYGSEEPLGKAVDKAFELGLVKSRDEVFITSKLLPSDAHPDLVLPALKTSLQKLGLEYVDLYLIHWPLRLKPEATGPADMLKENVMPSFDMKGIWEAMEECCRLGLGKVIGVSNFVYESPILKEIAFARQKTSLRKSMTCMVIQIALRWIYEEGVSPIVRSFNKEEMKETLNI